MAERSRIEQLRRRVEHDPASIAFAQLAEEYRRAGEFEEAVRVAHAGLEQHPGYLSARVTLGRALIELGRFDEAEPELESVVSAAPDNLAAIRALADIHQKRGDAPLEGTEPLEPPPPPHDLPHIAEEESFQRALASLDGLAVDRIDVPPPVVPPIPDAAPPTASGPRAHDPALDALEAWHDAILRDRKTRDNQQ